MVSVSGFSQNSNCDFQFTDSGGATGNYSAGSDFTYTICPNIFGDVITVTFTEFNVEAGFDGLYVYDGNSINSPQIASSNPAFNVPGGLAGAFWGNTIPGPFTSSPGNGCLTFRFKSGSSVEQSGWIANVSCAPPIVTTGFHLNAFLDSNNNGIKENDENYFTLGQFNYELIGVSDGGIITPIGFYNFFENNSSNNYNFGYTINPQYSGIYSVSVPNYTNINIGNNVGLVPVNFPITSNNNYNDLEISLSPYINPRAGFNYSNRIKFTNNGNQTIANGNLTFTNSPENTIVSTSETVTTTSTGFTYNFNNLAPFESRYINVVLSVPSIPTVSIGQLLTNSATISTNVTEYTLNNNETSNTQEVIAAYDPNDITESHGEKIVFSTFNPNEYLTYTIRFENTGTAPATDVTVTNALDAMIDESSVLMVDSSNNYILNKVGTNLSWQFDNIELPVSIENTNVGKGYITYKAKLKPGYAVGTIIPNQAKIYFDTNPAIDTNTFNTEFVSNLSNTIFLSNNTNFVLYPIPSNDNLNILNRNKIEILEANIYNQLGQLLHVIKNPNDNLNISNLQSGNYIVSLVTLKEVFNYIFVKE